MMDEKDEKEKLKAQGWFQFYHDVDGIQYMDPSDEALMQWTHNLTPEQRAKFYQDLIDSFQKQAKKKGLTLKGAYFRTNPGHVSV